MASVDSKTEPGYVDVPGAVEKEHIEDSIKPGEAAADAAAQGQAVSGYEGLSLWETIKTFKIATMVCFAAAFSAATDGYQIGYAAILLHQVGELYD
jgi:hypothetical protein